MCVIIVRSGANISTLFYGLEQWTCKAVVIAEHHPLFLLILIHIDCCNLHLNAIENEISGLYIHVEKSDKISQANVQESNFVTSMFRHNGLLFIWIYQLQSWNINHGDQWVFFQLEIITNGLVSSFLFIYILMLCFYGHYWFSVAIDHRP